jgi:hypothetical protein
MADCNNKKNNLSGCNCTYEPCSRKGICCQCIAYHRDNNELPACFFPAAVEKTFDRSVERFLRLKK